MQASNLNRDHFYLTDGAPNSDYESSYTGFPPKFVVSPAYNH
jgi:hypothetical protein